MAGNNGATNIRDLMKSTRGITEQPAPPTQEGGGQKDAHIGERKQTSYNANVAIWKDAMLIADFLQMDKGEAIDAALTLFNEKYADMLTLAQERIRLAEERKRGKK